jgi:hypothetical protein
MRRRSEVEENSVARDVALVVAGIGIGTGVALLLAPSSGEEVRHAIGRRYRRTVRQLGRRKEDLRDRVEDLLDHAGAFRRGAKLLAFRRLRDAERRYREA